MNIPEAEKLLGGYATGTLTEAERATLLEASLRNQALFEALADEEALRELLADPATRRRLAASLAPAPKSLLDRLAATFWRPLPMASAAALAAVAIAVVLVQRPNPPVEMAKAPSPPPAQSQMIRSKEEVPPPPAAEKQQANSASYTRGLVLRDAKKSNQPAAEPPPPAFAAPPASPVVVGALAERQDAGKLAVAESLVKEKRAAAAEADEAPRAREEAAVRFQWEIQRQDTAGVFRTVPNTAAFRAGEAVRLAVEARQAGQLVVIEQSGNTSRELFTRQVQPGDHILIPPAGSLLTAAGERELVVQLLDTTDQLRAKANSAFRSQNMPMARNSAEPVAPVRIRLRFVE